MSRNPENVVLKGWLKGRRFMDFLMGGWVGARVIGAIRKYANSIYLGSCVLGYIKRTYFIVKIHSKH